MLHQVIESLVELGGANINMCLHQVHFWSYNLMIDPPFNAPPSYIIIWSIHHSMLHQVIESLVELGGANISM